MARPREFDLDEILAKVMEIFWEKAMRRPLSP
jgi:hypothetical protein